MLAKFDPLIWFIAAVACAGCSTYAPRLPNSIHPLSPLSQGSHTESASSRTTIASWYGPRFNGRLTSNGEIFNQDEFTAASRTLPLGTYARVTNMENGKSVLVRVNDRGPYVHGRGIDLSEAAAERLGLAREGLARVRVSRLDTTASAIPDSPERWSGRARMRRRYHHHHHGDAERIARDPIGTWLLELLR
jgi:rare lipoprotein A (peptidoglycan hydrolase)